MSKATRAIERVERDEEGEMENEEENRFQKKCLLDFKKVRGRES